MIKLVAFDFDGTVAESVDLCLATFGKVFRKMLGDRAPGRDEIFQQFGRNEIGIMRPFFGPRINEAFAEFCRLHEEMHRKECPAPFPGMMELFLFLKSRGVKLVLLTGRCPETGQISIRMLGLTGIFDAFWYGSAETTSKSAQMKEMLEQFQLRPEEAVYVGDAASDAVSSSEAGLTCLSAAWAKSTCRTGLEKVNPGLVFDTILSLQQWLESRI